MVSEGSKNIMEATEHIKAYMETISIESKTNVFKKTRISVKECLLLSISEEGADKDSKIKKDTTLAI